MIWPRSPSTAIVSSTRPADPQVTTPLVMTDPNACTADGSSGALQWAGRTG